MSAYTGPDRRTLANAAKRADREKWERHRADDALDLLRRALPLLGSDAQEADRAHLQRAIRTHMEGGAQWRSDLPDFAARGSRVEFTDGKGNRFSGTLEYDEAISDELGHAPIWKIAEDRKLDFIGAAAWRYI